MILNINNTAPAETTGGKLQPHINEYGNVNITSGIPEGLARIEYDPILKKLGVQYAKAMCGFKKRKRQFYPEFSGVVIDESHKQMVADAIAQRDESKRLRVIKSRRKITEKMNSKMVAEALYVLNKHAKSDKSLYSTKDRVLTKFTPSEFHVNTFMHTPREYIIRKYYYDESEYEYDLSICDHDDYGRPYLSFAPVKQTNCYNYYEIEGFGFHSPTETNSYGLPEKQIGDGSPFESPRGVNIEKLGKRLSLERSKIILDLFCGDSGCEN